MGQTPNNAFWLVEEGGVTARQLYNDNWELLDELLAVAHTHVYNHVPAETVDGGTANFSTSGTDEMIVGSSQAYLGGARQRITTDYTEDGDAKGITFVNNPPSGMDLRWDYDIVPPTT